MLTEFGKEMRKIRLDLGITLFEMAQKTGVSSSFLSAVETGKKPVPADYVDVLSEKFDLVKQAKAHFMVLADKTRREVRIKLMEGDSSGAELATAFARNFSELSSDQKEQIKAILNNREGK
jgi:transcriptional regulator with XRE-family HTH domain